MREEINPRTPMHINFKFSTHIRNKACLKLLKRAILNARSHGLRIIHFSLQSNHVHLIVEAENNKTLTRGMRSLTVTFAKGLNKGRVQLERYHLHILKSLRETRNAIYYVLFNKQKHEKGTYSQVDEYSSLTLLENALPLIQKFAKETKITLKVGRSEAWKLEKGRCFLLREAIKLPREHELQ